jgi:predicted PurR-regulated permease PerM
MALKEYPFYFKSTVILFGLFLLTYVLYILGDILVPFAFAAFIAILLNPLCNFIQRYKVPKPLAIILTLFIAIVVVGSIFYFLSSQMVQFGETFPALKVKFGQIVDGLEKWIALHFGIATQKQVQFIKDALDSSQALVGKTLGTVIGTLSLVILVPVYVFMMLFYKPLILNFVYEVFKEEHTQNVAY